MNSRMVHICVCICTFQRPQFLHRLLEALKRQVTGDQFTYSVVVVDNDYLRSAEAEVAAFVASASVPIRYCVEPEQNISKARNKAIENAIGDYLALIDDDEFPNENWLLTLLEACRRYDVDAVVGPVLRHFDEKPPKWIVKGNFWQRVTYPTGTVLDKGKGRINNALLKREVFAGCQEPFRPELRAGEDQDFVMRMVEQGRTFVWCNEAVVHEIIPPMRWKRSFMLRRSLLQGSAFPLRKAIRFGDLAKSVVAVPVYTILLPITLMLGHHRFMNLLVKLAYHSGMVLACLGIQVIRDPYVTS